jgi:manganese/iron transport system ATP-binding protein
MTDSLDLREVSVGYGDRPALEAVSLSIPHGAQVAVIGPNGAGKSALFKAMVGLLPLRRGTMLIHGRPPAEYREPVAYVPQREEVDWRFPVTVQDVVAMGRFGRGSWLGKLSGRDRDIVEQSLERLGIRELAKRPIGDLSGGQQQRVFLARALAQGPHILLLDEPFTGVDIATRETIFALLSDLRERSVTVLLSTHDLDLASERFDLVVLLNRRLVSVGPPVEVFTAENLQEAFGGQMVVVNGKAIVVDQCCGGHGPVGAVDSCRCDSCCEGGPADSEKRL